MLRFPPSRVLPKAHWWLTALLVACGSPEAPSKDGTELLARAPDGLVEELGGLTPDPREQWRSNGRTGWQGFSYSYELGQRLGVWTRRNRATLNLPSAGGAIERIELELGAPDVDAESNPVSVKVTLNGASLGELSVGAKFERKSLSVPTDLWRRGDNELALSVGELRPHPDGPPLGVCLANVRWSEPRRVQADTEGKELHLPTGTAALYRLETSGPSHLTLNAQATSPGTLQLLAAPVDQRTGEALPEGGFDRAIEVAAGSVDVPFPLPGDTLLQFEVGWEGDAPLVLESIRLQDEGAPDKRPSIVFICLDTLSAKNLSLYGYTRETSPNLDRLANESVTFERCITNAPWTMPSAFSFMTGLYPSSHRLKEKGGDDPNAEAWERWFLARNRLTLAESLRSAGYRTGGFVEHLWLTPRFGFGQGFDTFDFSACEIEKGDPVGGWNHVTKLAKDWLYAGEGSPSFLFIHAYDVHAPYASPEPWHGQFRDDAMAQDDTLLPSGGLHSIFGAVPAYVSRLEYEGDPTHVSRARIHAAYDEGVLRIDDLLGQLFAEFEERGVLDESIIVITADHGETMGEGPYYFGHGVLEEPVLHVPLFMRLPGGRSGGLRIDDPVSLVDLYPTLLELAGVTTSERPLHGRSLVPLIEGNELPEHPVYSSTGIMRQASVESGGWRLVVRALAEVSAPEVLFSHPAVPEDWRQSRIPESVGAPMTAELMASIEARPDYPELVSELRRMLQEPIVELYPLGSPPGTNLAKQKPKRLARMRKLLAQCAAEEEEARRLARPDVDAVSLSPEAVRALGKLGYADEE